jgi:ribosomal protein S12 methylthiotransferase accessory factor
MPIAHVASSGVSDGRWLGEADICLLASDSIDAALCLAVNAACVKTGVKLIPGLGMGEVAQVGPLIEAGVGPCLQCLNLRVQAALGRPALVGPYSPNSDLGERVGRHLASLATDSSGQGKAVVYMWSDGRAEEHLALRSYDCPACGEVEPTAPHVSRPVEPFATGDGPDDDRILSLEPLIVDPIMGVVRWVTDYVAGPDEPDIAHAVASVADRRWDHAGVEIYAGGNDLDRRQARAAALGEALDRLASSPPQVGNLTVGRYGELGDQAVDPRLFDLFHDDIRARADFPYGPIDAETELSWVWSWSLGEARPKLVPAARVFLPLDTGLAGDMPDAGNVSGAATNSTPESAILAGLLEVIERDTFMIAWSNRLPMTGVTIDATTDWNVGRYVSAFNRVGIEVRCSTITIDWDVPLAVALARSERLGDPAVVVSAAAATDLATACSRALKELSANLAFVRNLLRGQPELPSPDPRLVRTPEAHALLYANPDMTRHLETWWAPDKSAPLIASEVGGDQGHLRAVVDRVMRHDNDVLAVNLTLPGLAERGLWTYKTLVPGAYPMNFDSMWPQLGGKRLINAPVEAGVTTHPLTLEDLNPVPHPFP